MTLARELLDELQRHHVHAERHGDHVRLRAPAAPPPDLLARMRRHKAELLAELPDSRPVRPVVHFRLADHPPNAWATCIGKPGESREACIADLKARWPQVEVQP